MRILYQILYQKWRNIGGDNMNFARIETEWASTNKLLYTHEFVCNAAVLLFAHIMYN